MMHDDASDVRRIGDCDLASIASDGRANVGATLLGDWLAVNTSVEYVLCRG